MQFHSMIRTKCRVDVNDKWCAATSSICYHSALDLHVDQFFFTNAEKTSFKFGLADPRADSASARALDNTRKRLADAHKHRRWHLTTSEHMSLSKTGLLRS